MPHKALIALLLMFAALPAFAANYAKENPWRSPATRAAIRETYPLPSNPMLLAKKWEELSPEEKKRVKEAQDSYKRLPRDKKEQLRDRWKKMPKKERDKYKLEKDYR